MTIESKTSFADTPEGQGLCFPCVRRSTVELAAKETADEKIKRLMEENKYLREEIKALKTIIKNVNN